VGSSQWVPSTTKTPSILGSENLQAMISIDTEKLPSVSSAPAHLQCFLNSPSTDPYPFAVDEVFDAYRIIVESKAKLLELELLGRKLNISFPEIPRAYGCFSVGEHLLT